MQLTRELLLAYPGLHGLDGLCHLRVYEQPDHLPVVIAGALDDNPGSSTTNAIARLAAAVQASQFPGGRGFRLIEHYPGTLDKRSIPTYALVHFEQHPAHAQPHNGSRHTGTLATLGGEASRARDRRVGGNFSNPRWETIDDVEELLECTVAIWAPGFYTAGAVAGEEGERLRSLLAENANRAGEGTPD